MRTFAQYLESEAGQGIYYKGFQHGTTGKGEAPPIGHEDYPLYAKGYKDGVDMNADYQRRLKKKRSPKQSGQEG